MQVKQAMSPLRRNDKIVEESIDNEEPNNLEGFYIIDGELLH